jgi:hypothetical protein
LGDSRWQVTGEAKLLWNVSNLWITAIILGKPKALQVEEHKALNEYIVSMIDRIMSLTKKDIGGGMGYPTGLSQSKVISSKPGGRGLGEIKTLSRSKGAVYGMLMT